MCPFTQELGCAETSHKLEDIKRHIDRVHRWEKFLCALGEDFGCTSRFTTVDIARRHGQVKHQNVRYACPWAEKASCGAVFTTSTDAKHHVEQVHKKTRIPCPLAKETHCDKTYCTKNQATIHANAVHRGLRYPCPLAKEYCNTIVRKSSDLRQMLRSTPSNTWETNNHVLLQKLTGVRGCSRQRGKLNNIRKLILILSSAYDRPARHDSQPTEIC